MRLFVAAEPSAAVRRAAAAAVRALRKTLESRIVARDIRWIPPDDFHLTVWFLGEVSDQRSAAVLDALRPPFDENPFTLRISRFGAFPPAGSPRVVWMGVEEGQTALSRLNEAIGSRLAPLGFRSEGRPFSAHLTVARVKAPFGGADRRAFREVLARRAAADAGACRVDHLTIFRSRTSPDGAQYEPLVRVPLKECSPSCSDT